MSSVLAFFFGLIFVTAFIPGWSQPSIEPKSFVLLGAGALAWGWLSCKGRPLGRFPWVLVLPCAWLIVSALWSPSPFFGFQRILWLLAACGIGTLFIDENIFDRFMHGFLAGTALHGALICLQWIPSFRAWLHPSLGIDPYQGIGRGLFHNTNMAAQPLLILAVWLLLSADQPARWWKKGQLLWILPALALTQSRLAIATMAGVLAFMAIRELRTIATPVMRAARAIPLLLLAFAWSQTAHRWGWVLPGAGCAMALLSSRSKLQFSPLNLLPRSFILSGLLLATLAGMATHAQKNAAQTVVQGTVVQGDASQLQRSSYYRVAVLAFLDRPFTGQGLGAARSVYPQFVDRNRPAAETAYGDMTRPNNLHSEPLELLMEGGLPLILLMMGGYWWDRRHPHTYPRVLFLLPVAVLGLLDFPFHNPLGLLWVGITLASINELIVPEIASWPLRLTQGAVALGLLLLAGLQFHVASARPRVEAQFMARQNPADTHEKAKTLWAAYPFSADIFDLDTKSAIQAAMDTPSPSPTAIEELDRLLKHDPYDHHLLLARAQIARRTGDARTTKELLTRYAEVAPRDPARYFRLAKDALNQGKPQLVPSLLQTAHQQPGFGPEQETQARQLAVQAEASLGGR